MIVSYREELYATPAVVDEACEYEEHACDDDWRDMDSIDESTLGRVRMLG